MLVYLGARLQLVLMTGEHKTISVFIQICPRHYELNSAHIVRRFLSSFRFVLDIVAHNVDGKSKNLQYLGVKNFLKF